MTDEEMERKINEKASELAILTAQQQGEKRRKEQEKEEERKATQRIWTTLTSLFLLLFLFKILPDQMLFVTRLLLSFIDSIATYLHQMATR